MFPTINYGSRGLKSCGSQPAYRDRSLSDIESLIDRFFEGFGGSPANDSFFIQRNEGFPPLALAENEHGYTVEAEIPGVPIENIEISVAGSELTIKGRRANEQRNSYHRRERFSGEFTRVLKLAAEIDAAAISAELKDGVLKITLPKGEAAKSRKIEVRTN